jgi:hypothetical protein
MERARSQLAAARTLNTATCGRCPRTAQCGRPRPVDFAVAGRWLAARARPARARRLPPGKAGELSLFPHCRIKQLMEPAGARTYVRANIYISFPATVRRRAAPGGSTASSPGRPRHAGDVRAPHSGRPRPIPFPEPSIKMLMLDDTEP